MRSATPLPPQTPANTAPLAVYVHWPWCKAKCPYCDFNSHAGAPREDDYIEALLAELVGWERALKATKNIANQTTPPPARPLASIFFGGGTPSLMRPANIARVIEACQTLGSLDDSTEITVECNPSSFGDEQPAATLFSELRHAGVNRVSIGVQGLEAEWLAFLGRAHRVEDALATLDAAQAVFSNVNADVIYGLPEQDLAAWQNQLERLAGRGLQHISAYQLTIEPNTRFYKDVKDGLWQPVDSDTEADFYDATHEILVARGYNAYETSNFAQKGRECRHNLHVWRYGDYLGVGAGAHGRVQVGGTRLATVVARQPEGYLQRMATQNEAFAEVLEVDPVTAIQEALFFGLRLSEGADTDALIKTHGRRFYEEAIFPSELTLLTDAGLLEHTDGHLRTTPTGQPRLNALLRRLLRPLPAPKPLGRPVFPTSASSPSSPSSAYTRHTRVCFR